MRTSSALLGIVVLGLAAVVGEKSLLTPSRQMGVTPIAPVAVDVAGAAERLGAAVRLKTIAMPSDLDANAADSRHFDGVADNSHKFSPVRAKAEDLKRFHGTNERISTADYVELIQFYHRLLHNAAAP